MILGSRFCYCRLARVLAAVGLIQFGSGACNPGVRPEDEVWIQPQENRRGYVRAVIGVRVDLAQPVVEVGVRIPDEVGLGYYWVNRETPLRYNGYRDRKNRRTPYWGGGEIAPAALGTFPFSFSLSDNEVGNPLAFPVELVLSDSSVVRWDGPPGSERPAPRLVWKQGWRPGGRTNLVLVAMALVPLFLAGLWKLRQRVRNKG